MENKKIIILCPYPFGKAPSQRFRFEQYLLASGRKEEIKLRSFYSEKGMKALYSSGLLLKLVYLFWFFVRRKFHIIEALFYDKIFIHRELAPIGTPIYERFLKLFGKKIIYDFDDSIWLSNVSDVNRKFDFLKGYGKVKRIIKWADKITVGNQYLADYALKYNDNVHILPTTVDMENVHNQIKNQEICPVVKIGWTGSHTTAVKYLPGIVPIIKELSKKYEIQFVVISNHCPPLDIEHIEFIEWSAESELEDLLKMDIGIMPLLNEEWEKGKCSFKAIQYMSLGIPTVLSPHGNNKVLVEDGINGLFANSEDEWITKLDLLINDIELRKSIGIQGREKILKQFSLVSKIDIYKELFN